MRGNGASDRVKNETAQDIVRGLVLWCCMFATEIPCSCRRSITSHYNLITAAASRLLQTSGQDQNMRRHTQALHACAPVVGSAATVMAAAETISLAASMAVLEVVMSESRDHSLGLQDMGEERDAETKHNHDFSDSPDQRSSSSTPAQWTLKLAVGEVTIKVTPSFVHRVGVFFNKYETRFGR